MYVGPRVAGRSRRPAREPQRHGPWRTRNQIPPPHPPLRPLTPSDTGDPARRTRKDLGSKAYEFRTRPSTMAESCLSAHRASARAVRHTPAPRRWAQPGGQPGRRSGRRHRRAECPGCRTAVPPRSAAPPAPATAPRAPPRLRTRRFRPVRAAIRAVASVRCGRGRPDVPPCARQEEEPVRVRSLGLACAGSAPLPASPSP